MDLISVTVKGWRRFAENTTIQTNGKLISILGPNEAGKSSLLHAIRFLGTNEEVKLSDISRDGEANAVAIVGYFHLSPAELESAGLKQPTRLIVRKTKSGAPTLRIDPPAPKRDLGQRQKTKGQLERALASQMFWDFLDEELADSLEALVKRLDSKDEDLDAPSLEEIKERATQLKSLDLSSFTKYVQALPTAFLELLHTESKRNPSGLAIEALRKQIPPILLFGPAERDLHQEYDLDELKTGIPAALSNLADVAKLDIPKLIDAVDRGSSADIETIKTRSNKVLKDRFQEVWSQSGVHVSIAIRDRTLNILINNEEDQFTPLAERSDGFRQFIALQSFTVKERSKSPILLIDEAEMHLHYDAQADLVQMLSRQKVASKIIYTTHSAGCLPEDLGNGVRLVHRKAENESQSHVINRFWGAPEVGFSPLLIGMGASTLAFFPTRRALMVEGATEMLLLPTMLREATGAAVLDFQVIPGLSKVDKNHLREITGLSDRVAYLVDGDSGGENIRRELTAAGVSTKGIFALKLGSSVKCELEDFISDGIILAATNKLISKFSPGKKLIENDALGSGKKFPVVAKRFKTSTGKELSKVDLAYEILALRNEDPELQILEKSAKASLRKLAQDLHKRFFGKLDAR